MLNFFVPGFDTWSGVLQLETLFDGHDADVDEAVGQDVYDPHLGRKDDYILVNVLDTF